MSPRPYRSALRQTAADQTRARIVAAARELLAAPGGYSEFSVDAVARRAGVARMTVYYQFGSKRGLLEALFDDLAARGHLERLGGAFTQPDPVVLLGELIDAFTGFWATDPLVMRRLRALAAIDPDFDAGTRDRGERRREAVRVAVRRLADRYAALAARPFDDIVDALFVLTSFETYDALASSNRSPAAVAALVRALAASVLELDASARERLVGPMPGPDGHAVAGDPKPVER